MKPVLKWSVNVGEDPGNYSEAIRDGKIAEWHEKFSSWSNSFAYEQICDYCSHLNCVLTQKDSDPEYYSSVGVYCKNCNHIMWFRLPVN